jgi:putative membrane protein
MKNFKSTILQATFIIAAIIGTSSCGNNKPEDPKEVAEEKNEIKFDNNNDNNKNDAQFLVDAAEINREGISLGQLAQLKGVTSHVKELGKMMEDEHTKSLADLTALAKTKNISLPTSQTENGTDAYKKLNGKSGNNFGKEYSSMMVDKHKNAIELFEKAATDCTDLDIKAWATETLPTLRKHLDHSLMCQKECDKM